MLHIWRLFRRFEATSGLLHIYVALSGCRVGKRTPRPKGLKFGVVLRRLVLGKGRSRLVSLIIIHIIVIIVIINELID